VKCYIDNSVCLQSCLRNINNAVGPQPGDDARGSLQGFVMRDTCIGVPKVAAPGDTTPAPISLPRLPPPPLPIAWRWMEDDTELACSQLANAGRLLHDTLASFGWNILRLIWVSLKKEKKVCLCASGFL
jgi:hypothetical protein